MAGWAGGLSYVTTVYENNGLAGFSEFPSLTMTGVWACSLAWGDMDNDGDLDLAVAGMTIADTRVTTIYRNDGSGGLTELPSLTLTGVSSCSLAWGDCDNDGDLDLAVAGATLGIAPYGPVTTVYENNGAGGFSVFPGLSLDGVSGSSLAWGDCDDDGDLDLAVAGRDSSLVPITKIYENDGAGGFSEFAAPSPIGVENGSLAWGDADNDGDLDLAVAGSSGISYVAKIYENNGAGSLAELSWLDLAGADLCSLAWGDCDNDGDLDLAVVGFSPGSAETAIIYENMGAAGFAALSERNLSGVSTCSLAWGDCDSDGDSDLAVAGYFWDGSENRVTKIYMNSGPSPNAPPEQVADLTAFVAGGEVVFMWAEGSDVETPAGGLSYNLRVVDTGSGLDVFPAMAAADGWRRIPAIGPIRPGPSYAWHSLTLPSGDYEFQVQAIDSGLEGGPWSDPEPFTVP